jgi:hypothetical protein
MSILASSPPVKLSCDLDADSLTTNLDLLQGRRDYCEKLSEAFKELITILQAEKPEDDSIDSLVESGLFLSARSTFRSELAEAMETLDSSDGSGDEKSDTFEDSKETLTLF